MIGGEVRMAPHHLLRLPARQLLQGEERRLVSHVPLGPCVPQFVPAEVLDSGAFERLVPSPPVHLLDRLSAIREHLHRMLALLSLEHFERGVIQRNGNRSLPYAWSGCTHA